MRNTISIRYIMKKGIHAFKGRRIACEQALYWLDIVKSTRARGTREETRLRGAGKRKGELATVFHKISFPPRKPRDIVKRKLTSACQS